MIRHKICINKWSEKSVFYNKDLFEYGQYQKEPLTFQKNKSVFCLILRLKKKVYAEKISMRGRSLFSLSVDYQVHAWGHIE